jgi:hypothetical protein
MADAVAKKPIRFVVTEIDGVEVVFPPIAVEDAGGNSVRIQNMLKKKILVHHGGKLDTPDDPFEVDPRGTGAPPQKTFNVDANADLSGSKFDLRIEGSVINAFGRVGDPTIIIL